ncbi:slipin family protein [Candidatus Woesearchaeota archaeon]|nr:slipin family protein [Nanoarchaeota archaeon]MCB9370773.1 slipin family protein [Candidatus Woesearchaeota archaeon]
MIGGVFIFILVLIVLVFIFGGIKQLMEYERGIKFTLGRYSSDLGPGLNIVVPIFQSYQRVDIRVKTVDVPKQDCITKDNVSVNVDAVTYYYVSDVKKAILDVEDFYYAVSQLSQTTMRDVVGEVTLDELLANRDAISDKIRTVIDKASDAWGLKVERVELKHIELPSDMQRIMAREAEAEREKRGIIIKSEGEVIASENLAKAASILAKHPGAMQLRSLQTINDISSDASQKFIFFPIEMMDFFRKK